MLKSLFIQNLFGISGNNKNIEFNSDITILVGFNGSGKTTILNILNIIMHKNFYDLSNYKFKKILLKADECSLEITRINDLLLIKRLDMDKIIKKEYIHIVEAIIAEYENIVSKTKDAGFLAKDIVKNFESLIQPLYQETEIREEIHAYVKNVFILLAFNNNNLKSYDMSDDNSDDNDNDNIKDFKLDFSSNYFPTYRRFEVDINHYQENDNLFFNNKFNSKKLYKSSRINNTICTFNNNDIREIIIKHVINLSEYERRSLGSLAHDFTEIFLDISTPQSGLIISQLSNINCSKLTDKLEKLFLSIGIIKNISSNSPVDYRVSNDGKIINIIEEIKWAKKFIKNTDNNHVLVKMMSGYDNLARFSNIVFIYSKINKILSMYDKICKNFEDRRKPLSSLEETLEHFLNMSVNINRNGISFIKHGTKLTLSDLSAGEKQLVSLFVYIFLEKKDIILIDEPELSLHATWQREFIDKIKRPNMQLILTTHTPFIISHYGDKIVKVGECDV